MSQNCKAASRELNAWKVRAGFPALTFIMEFQRVSMKLSKRLLRAKHAVSLHGHLLCEVATYALVSLLIIPNRLQCGHIHCSDCLKGHLESTTRLFMKAHSQYQPPSEEYVQALKDPFTVPNLYLDATRWTRDHRTPRYQCTHCHEPLSRSPVNAFYLRSVIGALDQEGGTPAASSGNSHPLSKDFFDRYLLF